MLKNFLLLTFRNILKNKFYVIINVIGLGIALGCCITAYYNYKFEVDFDKIHTNKNSIYRIAVKKDHNGRSQKYGISPISLAPAIEGTLPGVKEIVRYSTSNIAMRYEEKIFNKNIAYVDENFFNVFDLNILKGNKDFLSDKSKIIISNELAETYFGDEDPIGKTINLYNNSGTKYNYIIAAIFEELPNNSSFYFDALTELDNHITMNEMEEFDWKRWVGATFLLVDDPNQIQSIENIIQKYVEDQNKARPEWLAESFYIESFVDMPINGRNTWANWVNAGIHPAQRIAPPIMAILILLLACLNFMNTSLAISNRRLKEIGLRKVFGGVRMHSVIQFLGENIVLCLFSLIISVFIGIYLTEQYNNMWPYMSTEVQFFNDIVFWIFLLGLLLLTGILAGAYPAFYVSKFNPIRILKGTVKYSGAGLFSKILLVLQFSLAIIGIISAVIFTQNAYYQDNLYLGYNKDQVIAIPMDDNAKVNIYKNAISQNPAINQIGLAEEHIGRGHYVRTLDYKEQKQEVDLLDIGKGYFNTMGLELVDGKTFDDDFRESDREKAIIVNEKFVEVYKLSNPIGEKFRMNDTIELTVVGVMKNIYIYGFWDKINPSAMRLGNKERMRFIAVQSNINNLDEIDTYLREKWAEIIPNSQYEGFYQDEILAEAKDINKQIKKMFMFLAIVSIILSLIGLYTLVSLSIIKRTREIGIRRVLGAPVKNIIRLLNQQFFIILIISSAIGSYVGYFLSDMLMGSIWVHYMDVTIFSFVVPVLFVLITAAITLSVKVYKASTRNPVESLRYE